MVDEGTEIILYYSNGKSPEGEVDFTIKFPSNSDGEQPSGRYSIDFIVYEETMRTVSTDTFILPIYTEYTQKVKGSGDKIKVVAYLNGRYKLGEYVVDFGNKTYEVRSEDVVGALTEAGAYPEHTEPPTEKPTEKPVTKVYVRDYTGLGYDLCKGELSSNDIKVEISGREYSDTVPYGCIISQDKSEEEIEKGSTIYVVVSDGPKPTEPPTEATTSDIWE